MSRPKRLLTQNREMRREGIWNWTLPAWWVKLPDGSVFNCCPMAGECAKVCYARNGTYLFSNVRNRHIRNLLYVLEDMAGWSRQMIEEIASKRFSHGRRVRIHDAGDFFSDEYLLAWLEIAASAPDVGFYCYTKEVSRFRRIAEPRPLPNFKWVFSLGGREDHLVDVNSERHAEVFPDSSQIERAGYHSQSQSDLLAVDGPPRVGIPANNIPRFVRRMAGRTLGQMQQDAIVRVRRSREK